MKWAKCNIGASIPESAGLYFSWGNTEGHPAGAGYDFSQEVYDTTPAAAITANLSLNQDAARVYLGNPWRMPTGDEFKELIDNCSYNWTQLNGVSGMMFTSNLNGKTLFFPAAGRYNGTALSYKGQIGDYWSSTYNSVTNARSFYLSSTGVDARSDIARRFGFTIRPVQPGTPNRSFIPPTPDEEPEGNNER